MRVYNGFEIEDGTVIDYYGDGGDVMIPQGVKDLLCGAFSNDNVDTITVPGSIKSIAPLVFTSLKSLKQATLLSGVEEIEESAFLGCTSLEAVYLPESLIKIDKQAFSGCSSLEKIYYSGTEEGWLDLCKGEGWDENAEKLNVICGSVDGEMEEQNEKI